LAALPAASLQAKPNSKFSGVQIGTITYSYRSMPEVNDAKALLKYIVDSGVSAIELMSAPAEAFVGAPAPAGRGGGGGRGRGNQPPLTPEVIAANQARQQTAAEDLKKFRLSVSMDKYKALRKMYNDAGVKIYGFKLEPRMTMSNEEYEYIFNAAEALGADHVTLELSPDKAFTQRNGDFGAKRGIRVAYHAHQQATITAWDEVLQQSKGNAINLDIGHFYAGTQHAPGGENPIPIILKHASRIASMHLKDRTKAVNGVADNLPWGKGQTPIKEVLQLMRKNKYKFPASVELEYSIPQGSDAVVETAKCVQYCKDCLA